MARRLEDKVQSERHEMGWSNTLQTVIFCPLSARPEEKNYPNNKHIFTTITDILLCGFSTIFVFRGFVFLIFRSLPREEK